MLNQKEIAGRLKLARSKKGYKSARSFSKQNNLAESTYAQHESGKRKLNTTTLLNYREKLSVNPGWILTGQEPIFLDKEKLESHNSTRYIVANVPKISVILKILIPFVMNGQIKTHKDLHSILITLYNNTEQYNFDLKDIKDALPKLIKDSQYENACLRE
ncbi:MAG: helix-turn-helix transcriptional regulator [Legionellales bacterium]|nr:helix-turn-helix transcriptional regulator [Legionellales bacterium]